MASEPEQSGGASGPYSLLIVEDNPDDARLVRGFLRRDAAAVEFTTRIVGELRLAIDAVQSEHFDAVLCDLNLPDSSGVETLEALRRAIAPDVPIVVLTGHGDAEMATRALRAGAQDYLVKGNFDGDLLVRSVRYAIERQLLHRRVELAERLSSLGRITTSIAHEFNNVLMSIQPWAEVIERTPSADLRSLDAARHIREAMARGKNISLELLQFTQPGALHLETFQLSSWLSGIEPRLRAVVPRNIELTFDVRLPLRVRADPEQLMSVLLHLVANAVQAIGTSGAVRVSVANVPVADARRWAVIGGPYARISVSDNGSGMTPETLRHAFEPMFTTRRNGSGLGLAMAHQILTRHGGTIVPETAEGIGTTMHILVPLAVSDTEQATPSSASQVDTRPARLLVVDDEEAVRLGLLMLLELEGFDVAGAASGGEALAEAEKRKPDAAVLDVGLEDVSGEALCDMLRERYPDLPVVFSTGHALRESLSALIGPRTAQITKPYEISELVVLIRKVLGVSE